jgi:uncharacterized protein (DUF433 family)
MPSRKKYRFLEPRPGSNYRQLWVKGRHMRAEVLYRCTVGPEPRTPEEVAEDYNLPVQAVQEAIDYAVAHESLLTAEREREETRGASVTIGGSVRLPADHPSEV